MLADDYIQSRRKSQRTWDTGDRARGIAQFGAEFTAELERAATSQLAIIERAQRFVLSPQVVEAAYDLSRSTSAIDHSRDYIFTPATVTWIEWAGNTIGSDRSNRHAVMLDGSGFTETKNEFFIGAGIYVADEDSSRSRHEMAIFKYDFPGGGTIFQQIGKDGDLDSITRAIGSTEENPLYKRVRVERLGRFIAAALALINTPRVTAVVEHDNSVLNNARLKKGRPPVVAYSDVTIKPDAGWVGKSEMRRATGEKARHHVRTFMRLKRGKVELVKAHWRGNADRGYVLHRHVVRMDQEEAGPWKGEPLPAPRIMKFTDDIPE